MDKKATIYGLVDPRTNQVFYVGSTVNFETRMQEHLRGRRGNPGMCRIVCDLSEQGLRPKIRIFQQVPAGGHMKRERDWIVRLYKDGHPLENVSVLKYRGKPALRFALKHRGIV